MTSRLNFWGAQTQGRAANTETSIIDTPIILGTDVWLTVSLNAFSVIAVRDDNTLWGWGVGANHMLGLGEDVSDKTEMTQIGTDTDWWKVSVGREHVLALKTDGTLWSWGKNSSYRTAQGTDLGFTTTPTQIGTDNYWVDVLANRESTNGNSYAMRSNGWLYAWGGNSNGLTGRATTSGETQTPTLMVGGDQVYTQMSTQEAAFFAVRSDGLVFTVGLNSAGRTGRGTTSGSTTSLTQVWFVNNVIDISSNTGTTVVLQNDNTLWGWGVGGSYIGDGDTTNRTSAVQVGSGISWVAVYDGVGSVRYAKSSNGDFYAWGLNQNYATLQDTNVGALLVPTITTKLAGTETFIQAGTSMSYALTPAVPNIPEFIDVDAANVNLTTQDTSLKADTNVDTDELSLSLATFAATIKADSNVDVDVQQVTFESFAATLKDDEIVVTDLATIPFVSLDHTIAGNVIVDVDDQQLSLTSFDAEVRIQQFADVDTQQLTIESFELAINRETRVLVDAGEIGLIANELGVFDVPEQLVIARTFASWQAGTGREAILTTQEIEDSLSFVDSTTHTFPEPQSATWVAR